MSRVRETLLLLLLLLMLLLLEVLFFGLWCGDVPYRKRERENKIMARRRGDIWFAATKLRRSVRFVSFVKTIKRLVSTSN